MAKNPTSPRIKATDVVDAAMLAQLRRRSNLIGLALIAHGWGVIFLSMAAFYLLPNPITFLVAVMLIGARQLGLVVLMHDGAHNALFRTQSWNNSFSDWLCAYPLLARTDAYRRYHLQHHANTQQQGDPDLVLSAPFPITRKSLRRKIIRDLTGQTAYQQRKAQIINAFTPPALSNPSLRQRLAHFWRKLGGSVITNLVVLGVISLVFHWSYYLMFWLLPFMTWHMLITRFRNIAEHAMVPDDNDPLRNARTTKAGWVMRAFIAPYWVNYHVEHHVLMHVPCYRLVRLHKAMLAQGLGDKMEMADSYWQVLRRASSRPDNDDRPGKIVHDGRKRLSGNFAEGFVSEA